MLRWVRLLYLVYLLNLLWEPLQVPAYPPWAWVGTVGSVALFLLLYFRAFLYPSLMGTGGMMALGLAVAPLNFGATVYLIYAAASAGFLPGWQGVAGILISSILVPVAYSLSPSFRSLPGSSAIALLVFMTSLALATGFMNRALFRERQAQARYRELAALKERERIVRDLHDLLGQSLTHLILRAELAARLARHEPERAGGEMEQVAQEARKALSLVRALVRGYQRRLQEEIDAARRALEAAGILCEVEGRWPELTPEAEGQLALILREAVTNVIRYSQARRCWIRFLPEEGKGVRVEVVDDGQGVGPFFWEGEGLRSIRQRLAERGGELKLLREGQATKLVAVLPLGSTMGS